MYYVHSNVCLSVKLVPVFQSIGTLVPFGIPAESGRNVPPSRLGRPPNFHNKLHHNKIPLRPHIGTTSLRHHALLIAQLGINTGGLSILDLRSRTIPDFMISFTSALRHATSSIYHQFDMSYLYCCSRPTCQLKTYFIISLDGPGP